MRFLLWRSRPEPTLPAPQHRTPLNERPTWTSAPTQVFPTTNPGRAGNLTRAQRWRAGGWWQNGNPR
ncbi:hypothetical protein U2F26_08770 [Micromonospora sp. 4G57]|uniref:Uncharacterized protein n=1 Tax=Micromonospora sicca TaxID=2202420 RepID=A0ABU5JI53_9ACTN|nr:MULTISPECIES: hypothetical protein [unclassified Micromonospora]MDZ5442824.1 hypothetical protein [Micromonospora sp. 4G57]MDZ5492236.1 hypothetical protein [Micromonospora sp. 4G53]